MTEKFSNNPHHDLGGLDLGPVPVDAGADYELWEKRVDAMLRLLAGKAGLMTVDQLRRGIETLSSEQYDAERYYGKWTHSVAKNMIEKGVLTREEIDARISQIKRERGLV